MHFQIFWNFFHVLLNNWHVFYSRSIPIFGKVWGLLHLFLVEKNPLWRQWKDANLTTNSIAKLILLCQCSTKIPSSCYRKKKQSSTNQTSCHRNFRNKVTSSLIFYFFNSNLWVILIWNWFFLWEKVVILFEVIAYRYWYWKSLQYLAMKFIGNDYYWNGYISKPLEMIDL